MVDKEGVLFYPLGNCVLRCPTDGVHAVVTLALSPGGDGYRDVVGRVTQDAVTEGIISLPLLSD